MGGCRGLLSFCHAGTMLPAPLPTAIFIPPQPCFSLSYFKQHSWRKESPVPGSRGPRTASLPAHAARAQGTGSHAQGGCRR